MYSIVLMAAMSGAPEVPDFCRGRCGCACGGGWCGGGWCGSCGRCGGWNGCRARCGGWCGCYSYGCHSYGCYGCGCCASYMPYPIVAPPIRKGESIPPPKKTEDSASLIINLPADARLIIDGNAMKSSSARRVFVTPPLQSGKDYYYTVRAEIVRDGQVVATEQNAYLRAGRQTTVTLEIPATTIAASRD